MPDLPLDHLTADEATRVWERAARLQAEAGSGDSSRREEGHPTPVPGFALTQVRAAALEAGIASEYVEAALAMLQAERLHPAATGGRPLARKFLGNPPDSLLARRRIEASPDAVLQAMEAVLPGDPYRLVLVDRRADPLDGGAFVFDVPGMGSPFDRGFAYAMYESGIRQLSVAIQRLPGSEPACEVTVHGAVTSQTTGMVVGGLLTTLGGALGTTVFALIGAATGIVPIVVAAGVGGMVVGGGLTLKGFRALYRRALGIGHRALEGLLNAVAVQARGGWRAG